MSNVILKKKMSRTKQHIQAKEYDQARAILKTVDHPTARKWEAQLDKIAPRKKKTRYTAQHIRLFIISVLLTIIIVPVALAIISNIINGPRTETKFATFDYCFDVYVELEMYESANQCSDWSDTVVDGYYFDQALACYNRYGDLKSEFAECMIREEILPPGVVRR